MIDIILYLSTRHELFIFWYLIKYFGNILQNISKYCFKTFHKNIVQIYIVREKLYFLDIFKKILWKIFKIFHTAWIIIIIIII